MIRRLAALALLVAGAALHAQTPCAAGPALFHISEFGPKKDERNAVYIKLANKSALEFLRRPSATGTQYVPDEQEIRAKFMEQIGEPCTSKFSKNLDNLKTDDLFVESSLRRILKQLTESEPAELEEAARQSQALIQKQESEIKELKQKHQEHDKELEQDISDLRERLYRLSQTAHEYSWMKLALFFFGGMLTALFGILAAWQSKWRPRFFREAKVPVSADDVRLLLSDSESIRSATQSVAESLSQVSPVTPEEIAEAVAERLTWGQAQLGTLLNLLARLPFHPRFLTADLRQRLVTTAQPATDLLSRQEADVLVTQQRFEDVRRQAVDALGLVRHAFDGLGTNSDLRALLNERSLAAMYQYADEGLSRVNLMDAVGSEGAETAISVFRRLHRGQLLLSTYLIPVLPESEVAVAALLLRSLQVAVNEMWTLLYLMGIQPDELILLRQPPHDAEVKQTSDALGAIREHFPNISRILQQSSLSGKAVCDFEEVGYSFNNRRQKRSVVYELAHNKPPREAASKPEPVVLQEPPQRAAQVVPTVRQETKPAEITTPASAPASLFGTLEEVPPQVASLRQLLASGRVSALSSEDVRRWTALIDNAATYRDGVWQLSQFCGNLFRKRDTVSAGVLRDALEKCGVIFKDADIGERADVQPDFEKEPHQRAMSQSLVTETEVKAFKSGAVVKQLAPFIALDGKVQKGLVVVRFADF